MNPQKSPAASTTARYALLTALLALPAVAIAAHHTLAHDRLPHEMVTPLTNSDGPGVNTSELFAWTLSISTVTAVATITAIWLFRHKLHSTSDKTRGHRNAFYAVLFGGPVTALPAAFWFSSVIATNSTDNQSGQIFATIAILIVVPIAWSLIAGVVPRTDYNAETPTVTAALEPHESAFYTTTLTYRVFWWTSLFLIVVTVLVFGVIALLSSADDPPPATLIVILAIVFISLLFIVMVGLTRLTTTIDRFGVTVRSSLLRFPLRKIPLSSISSATAKILDPADWGGIGWRWFGDGTAVIDGRRPGLAIALKEHSRFAVTLSSQDDAEDAAATLESLTGPSRQ